MIASFQQEFAGNKYTKDYSKLKFQQFIHKKYPFTPQNLREKNTILTFNHLKGSTASISFPL